jgi:hypothetical protein
MAGEIALPAARRCRRTRGLTAANYFASAVEHTFASCREIASTSLGRGGGVSRETSRLGPLGSPVSLTKPAVGGFHVKHRYGHPSCALHTQAHHSAALRLISRIGANRFRPSAPTPLWFGRHVTNRA